MLSDKMFEIIADDLEGCTDYFPSAPNSSYLSQVLVDRGLSLDYKNNGEFWLGLDNFIFLCEECDQWLRPDVKVYNEKASITCCEECDDRLKSEDDEIVDEE